MRNATSLCSFDMDATTLDKQMATMPLGVFYAANKKELEDGIDFRKFALAERAYDSFMNALTHPPFLDKQGIKICTEQIDYVKERRSEFNGFCVHYSVCFDTFYIVSDEFHWKTSVANELGRLFSERAGLVITDASHVIRDNWGYIGFHLHKPNHGEVSSIPPSVFFLLFRAFLYFVTLKLT